MNLPNPADIRKLMEWHLLAAEKLEDALAVMESGPAGNPAVSVSASNPSADKPHADADKPHADADKPEGIPKSKTLPRANTFYSILKEKGGEMTSAALLEEAKKRGSLITGENTVSIYLRQDARFMRAGRGTWKLSGLGVNHPTEKA